MKTILFCRVSSKEQQQEGYSLPAQERYLQEYADKQGLKVDKVFSVSESASGVVQRKIFNQMLEYVRKNKIPTITVETTDRLTRNFADVPMIDKWVMEDSEHQIHLAKESAILHREAKSHEWFMWRVKVATAEYYVRLLSENVKKGQKEKINEGWLPGRPPIGYITIGEKGKRVHVIDTAKSHFIKQMFELYATGDWSILRLTNYMYEQGLRNENGNKVTKSRMHELLHEVFYIGQIKWKGKAYAGKHETFISTEVFQKVQELLSGKGTPKYSKHSYLFKGLIRCSECNGVITWECQKGHLYGHCNGYRPCSQKVWSKEPEVEAQLLDEFGKLEIRNQRLADWIRKALKEVHKDETEFYSSAINELNQRHEQVQKRLDRLYDDKIDGRIDQTFYDRKFQQYSEEKQQVVSSIQKHSNANLKYFELGANIFDLSQRAREIYQKAKSDEDKRSLLQLVFSDLTLDEGKLSINHSKPFQVLVEAVQLTNSSKTPHKERFAQKIFEPAKQAYSEPVSDTKRDPLGASRPLWLRR